MRTTDKKIITIHWSAYGWGIEINDRTFSWDHNEDDMGTKALVDAFEFLGYEVDLKDVY